MDISFQLYSARNAEFQIRVLPMLAGLGYAHVEGYGGVYGNAPAYRTAMDQAGLTMPSGHFGVTDLEENFEASIDTARIMGMRHIVAPYLDEADRPNDLEGYKAFAARLAKILPKVAGEGLSFSWHNHDFEFLPLPDGTIPMEVILSEVPELLWEADLAWVVRGGGDPAEWLTRYGDRLMAVHVKDIAPEGENTDQDGWADVGHGTMNWASLVAQARAAAPQSLMIVEHDNPSDIERFASNSIAAIRAF